MAVIYARALAQELVPHVLSCLDCIAQPSNLATKALSAAIAAGASAGSGSGSGLPEDGPARARAIKEQLRIAPLAPLRVERLLDAENALCAASFSQLKDAWRPLMEAGLLADKPFTPSPLPKSKAPGAGAGAGETALGPYGALLKGQGQGLTREGAVVKDGKLDL